MKTVSLKKGLDAFQLYYAMAQLLQVQSSVTLYMPSHLMYLDLHIYIADRFICGCQSLQDQRLKSSWIVHFIENLS